MQNRKLMQPDIRIATAADATDLAAIRAQCFNKSWDEKTFSDLFASPDIICLTIPNIAYALAQKIPPESELITIAVAPAHRRRGIAENLLQNLWQNLLQHGIHTIHLEVSENLIPAQNLYKKLGFQPIGRRTNYYGAGQDAILMRLERPL